MNTAITITTIICLTILCVCLIDGGKKNKK